MPFDGYHYAPGEQERFVLEMPSLYYPQSISQRSKTNDSNIVFHKCSPNVRLADTFTFLRFK